MKNLHPGFFVALNNEDAADLRAESLAPIAG